PAPVAARAEGRSKAETPPSVAPARTEREAPPKPERRERVERTVEKKRATTIETANVPPPSAAAMDRPRQKTQFEVEPDRARAEATAKQAAIAAQRAAEAPPPP